MSTPSALGECQHDCTCSRISFIKKSHSSTSTIHSLSSTISSPRKEDLEKDSLSRANLILERKDKFGRLPPEIRVMIYDLLLVHDGIIPVDVPIKNRLAILQTCRLYHHEASHIFYGKNHFIITRVWDPATYSSPVMPIAEAYLPLLKRITISINTGHPNSSTTKKGANLVQSLVHTNIKLDQLTITLGSNINPMVAYFFDDNIMGADHPIVHALTAILHLGNIRELRVRLKTLRFGKSIAHGLHDIFTISNSTSDRSLKFYTKNSYSKEAIVVDLTKCERSEQGVYITDRINPESNLDWGDAATYSYPFLSSSLGLAHGTLQMPTTCNDADDEDNTHVEQEDDTDEAQSDMKWESARGQSTLIAIASWFPDLLQ